MTSNYSKLPAADLEDGITDEECGSSLHSSPNLDADVADEVRKVIPSTEVESSSSESVHVVELDENSSTMEKACVLLKSAVPMIISFFLGFGGNFINLMFAGHFTIDGKNTAVIAGVSLANLFANVTFMSILIGMSSAIETLASQHNGAKNYKEVGIILQRAILILGVIAIPIVFLWYYTGDIFALLGVEKDVCEVIRQYIRIRTLTIPADIFNICFEKYLMSIGVTHPSMWMNISFNLLILLTNSIFVYHFHMGYTCLAWSWVISIYLSDIIQIILSLRYEEVNRTLQPLNREALTKWWEFCSLGIPGAMMICSEWWAYEVLTIFASLLGTEEVAAQTIILQTSSLAYMIPLGLNIATASLVGNALGAGKKKLAITMGKLALILICIFETVASLAITYAGSYFVDLFTNDENVREVAISVLPFLSIFVFIDGIQGICSGILRGAGRQMVGATANIMAFYAFGLPAAWFICFRLKYRVAGLIMGLSVGTSLQCFVLLFLILVKEDFIFSKSLVEDTKTAAKTTTFSVVDDEEILLGESSHVKSPMIEMTQLQFQNIEAISPTSKSTVETNRFTIE